MKDQGWVWVPGFKNYYKISLSKQKVKSIDRVVKVRFQKYRPTTRLTKGKELKSALSDGYLSVVLCKNGKRRTYKIHRLLLETFVGECPPGMQACHKDDDRTNNNIDNIYWGTPKQNGRDASRNGKLKDQKGENNGAAKLSNKDVRKIRKFYETGDWTYKELANKFGVSIPTICLIIKGINWGGIK